MNVHRSIQCSTILLLSTLINFQCAFASNLQSSPSSSASNLQSLSPASSSSEEELDWNSSFTDTVPSKRFQPKADHMWTNRIIFTVLYGILFLLGLTNVLVLFIVGRYRRMRTVTNILIFNLCLADLVYISFLPVVIMFQLLRDWMFGIAACKLFYVAESTAKYASVYFVGVLSLDRYLAMCRPHWCKRYRGAGLALGVAGVGWTLTALLMTPIYLYSTVQLVPVGKDSSIRICTVLWPQGDSENYSSINSNYNFNNDINDINNDFNDSFGGNASTSISPPPSVQFYFVTLTFVFCFGLPALVILCMYFKVVSQLLQASSRAERLRRRREKTYRKVTRMVLAVITCYILCWLPYWSQFLLVTYASGIEMNDALKILFNSIHLLPYLNCALNPVLYSLMTENFRRILSELFPIFTCRDGRRKLSQQLRLRKISTRSWLSRRRSSEYPRDELDCVGIDSDRLVNVRPSITHSIRLVSDLSLNLLAFPPRTNSNPRETVL